MDSGASAASAARASSTAGSSSYSTVMRSSASCACSSVSAATAATGSPTKRTRSMARNGWSWIDAPKVNGKSRPVTTDPHPGRRAARDASIATIRAWAWGLRRTAPVEHPGWPRRCRSTAPGR